MSKDTGGPAFPIPLNPGESYQSHQIADGMTLRDYAAIKAMQGICAHHDTWGLPAPEIAERAYQMADAMLKERAK